MPKTAVTQVQFNVAIPDLAEWRKAQIRERIADYRSMADAAMKQIKAAPKGSEELSAARKDYFFNTASALRLQDMLGEPC